MVIADFQIEDKASRPRFFQKIFLVADIKLELILEMSFLKISNANVLFGKRTLAWKSYTTSKAISTTKRVLIINKKDFVIAVLNANNKTIIVYVTIREREKIPVYYKRQA